MNSNLKAQLESILFVSSRVLKKDKIIKILKCSAKELEKLLAQLQQDYKERQGGLALLIDGDRVQMVTAPEVSAAVQQYLKEERSGELTRPSLETLAVIAYRGPVTKAEIELIRGVNCSLILRNLLIRGLIVERMDPQKGVSVYQLTFEFIQYLGVRELKELPDFQKLNKDINLQELLNQESAAAKALGDKGDFFQNKDVE